MIEVPTDWAKTAQPITPKNCTELPWGNEKNIHHEWLLFQVNLHIGAQPDCPPFVTVTFNFDFSLNG